MKRRSITHGRSAIPSDRTSKHQQSRGAGSREYLQPRLPGRDRQRPFRRRRRTGRRDRATDSRQQPRRVLSWGDSVIALGDGSKRLLSLRLPPRTCFVTESISSNYIRTAPVLDSHYTVNLGDGERVPVAISTTIGNRAAQW